MKYLLTLLVFCFVASALQAQDLVYRPKNPAFGGDTFNYQWLLSSAESQNTFTDPNARNQDDQSDIERFTENLNSQLLNQISRTLFNEQFGTEGLTEGTFSFGSLFIEIFPSSNLIS